MIAILYLNDVLEEWQGETDLMPEPGQVMRVRPLRGIMLVFSPGMLHRGRPLLAGRKVIANQWVQNVSTDWATYYLAPLVVQNIPWGRDGLVPYLGSAQEAEQYPSLMQYLVLASVPYALLLCLSLCRRLSPR